MTPKCLQLHTCALSLRLYRKHHALRTEFRNMNAAYLCAIAHAVINRTRTHPFAKP